MLGEPDLWEMVLIVNHVHLWLRLTLFGCLHDHEDPLLQILVDSILLVKLVLLLSPVVLLVLLFGTC